VTASIHLAPRFLQGGSGHIFIQVYAPRRVVSRAVVIMIPPLLEEMNKSRRMFSLQAQRFAENGYVVVIPDLFGLGDSEGELSDATFGKWRADLSCLVAWIADEFAPEHVHLLALRSGALILELLDYRKLAIKSLTLWAPVTRGSRLVRDLFRQALIVARNRGDAQISSAALREKMERAGGIEVSGYRFSGELLGQFESAVLPEQPPSGIDIDWFDIRTTIDGEAPAVPSGLIGRWTVGNRRVRYHLCQGPPFWHTAEISISQRLIDLTITAREDLASE